MALQKNDRITISITDMTENGEGIGRAGGYPLFVKDAMIGDRVEVIVTKPGKTYGFGRVSAVLAPSPDRVSPLCPLAAPCGGCQLQALSYPAQLSFKENKVRQHLLRLGGFDEAFLSSRLLPILGMENPWHYRNKAQIPFGKDKDGRVIAGYYAGRSHRIVPMEHCALNQDGFDEILSLLLAFANEFHIAPYDEESGSGLLRHALIRHARGSGQWMVCLVINGRKLPRADELVRRLLEIPGMTDISLSVNTARTNVILGQEILSLHGPGYITETIADLSFRVSPLAFFQVNPAQTEVLYAKALEFAGLGGKENVWDLYCGTGTISLFLARHAARVKGVEIVAPAIKNAKQNAALNGITNVDFFVGRSEEIFPDYVRAHPEETADVVVLDPPRKGCDPALLEALLACSPERIVYVSCNSATLARDLKILTAGDQAEGSRYRLELVQPVDMFPQTVSCETVCALSKLSEAKHHISVQVDMDELDLTAAESKATYEEIQAWVKEKYGFHVTHLNIAKTKRKCGIIERQNYNLPKSKNSRSPETPKEKEEAIIEAFRHFKMI